jgi:putative ABC transport system substrate-binding protein
VRIDLRIGGGDANRVRAYAEELTAMTPDVLAVFASVFDPVSRGFVASWARPGGNITGFSNFDPAMAGKWLELLKEIAPDVTRVVVIFDRANPAYVEFNRVIEGLAPSLHLQHDVAAVATAAELEHVIDSFARASGGGLIVAGGTVASAHRETITALAVRHRLPAIYSFGYYPRIGGLMSYGVDGVDNWRRAATYVDRILKGEKAADLPVQAPVKFELVINLKTAKALGLTVPITLQASADEVIE